MNIKKYADKLIELSIFLSVFLVPVIFYTRTNDVFEINKMLVFKLFVIVIVAAWAAVAAMEKKVSLIQTAFDVPVIGYMAACIITTVITRNIYLSIYGVYEDFEGIISVIYYILFFYIAVNFTKKQDTILKILIMMFFATFLISAYGLAQNFGFDFVMWNPETYSKERFFSTLGNPNFLAAYLIETIPVVVILFFMSERFNHKAISISVASVAAALIGLIVHVVIRDKTSIDLGIEWAMLLPVFLASFFVVKILTDRIPNKFLILFVLVCAITVLFLTKSRAGFFSFLAIVAMVGGYTIFDARKQGNELFSKNKTWFIVFGALFIVTLFVPKVQEAFATIWDRSKNLLSLHGITLTPRVYIWKSALMMFRDYPVFGTGIDTFQVMFPYYRFPIYWQLEWNGTPEKTHNIFLQVLATQGIVGMGFYLLLFVAFLKKSFNLIFGEKDLLKRYIIFSILMAVIAYIIQGLANYTVAAYGMVFWMALGLIISLDSTQKRTFNYSFSGAYSDFLDKNRGAVLGALAVVALIFSVALVKEWAADMYFKIGNIATSSEKDDLSIPYYARAVEFNPNSEIYWVKYGIAYEKLMRSENNPEKKLDYIKKAIDIHSRTINMNEMNGYNFNNLARVYRNYGDMMDASKYDDAIRLYNEAIKRDPNNAYFGLDLASVYISRKEFDKAAEICRNYIVMYPNFAVPYSYLGYLNMMQGKDRINDALYYYEQAVDNKQWFRDSTTELSTYSNLGILYFNLKRLDKALQLFEKVVVVRPDYLEGHLNLAKLYEIMKKYDESIAQYEEALKLNNDEPRATAALAALKKRLGR
jgi:tetratricopeptide (TPR) repeat protein